ncbi:hypothetical protein KT71_003971 [Congregibacter litoralis KT71]|uniref:Uncharacterized protein n=2 Tax=Congregibacter TaxID=393661 RepID=V7HVE6_9GAMM|nr:hypothetical protein KT71_003971 [Congregibacter litoralis KT71]
MLSICHPCRKLLRSQTLLSVIRQAVAELKESMVCVGFQFIQKRSRQTVHKFVLAAGLHGNVDTGVDNRVRRSPSQPAISVRQDHTFETQFAFKHRVRQVAVLVHVETVDGVKARHNRSHTIIDRSNVGRLKPVPATSMTVICAALRISAKFGLAANPMLCGKINAPSKVFRPYTASRAVSNGRSGSEQDA